MPHSYLTPTYIPNNRKEHTYHGIPHPRYSHHRYHPARRGRCVETDAQNAYDQKAAHRKGLLSTILSSQKNAGSAMTTTASHSGNSTLG